MYIGYLRASDPLSLYSLSYPMISILPRLPLPSFLLHPILSLPSPHLLSSLSPNLYTMIEEYCDWDTSWRAPRTVEQWQTAQGSSQVRCICQYITMQHMQDTTIHITVYYNTVKPSINFHKGSKYGSRLLVPWCRLDRLVSGVLVLARSSAVAAQLTQHIKQQFIVKNYLARVKVSNNAKQHTSPSW